MKEVVKIEILYRQFPCCIGLGFGTGLKFQCNYRIIYFVRENSNLREFGREREATDRRKRREFIVTLELDGESFIVTLEVDGEENAKEIDCMEEDKKEVYRIQPIVDDDKINYC